MKLAYLAGHSSIHTVKWVNEMAKRGHEVHLITMQPGVGELNLRINVHRLPFNAPFGYYLNVWYLKRLLRQLKPDILNTHYASGYGTLARLTGFHPNLLSVWGSDVFDFPYKSKLRMQLLRENLRAADYIASTSHIMKRQTESIFRPEKEIAVTPFGVDCERFAPFNHAEKHERIRIGTVKKMASKYGITTLIQAFAIVKSRFTGEIELMLVGGGPEEEKLKGLAKQLNIDKYVEFIGPVPHNIVPGYLNSFDIYVALSTLDSESFGVAIVEASACGVPVIVSDAGGLPEVVVDGTTGYIVPRNKPEEAADRLLRLVNDAHLRETMGKAGRKFVMDNYEWKKCADRMEELYKSVVYGYKKTGLRGA